MVLFHGVIKQRIMVLFHDNIKQRIMTAMFINVTFWAKMQSLEKISCTILENLDIFWFHIWYFVFLFVFFIFLLWHWSCSEVRICVPSNVTVTAAELTKDAAGCAAASQNEVKCDAGEVVWPPLLLLSSSFSSFAHTITMQLNPLLPPKMTMML